MTTTTIPNYAPNTRLLSGVLIIAALLGIIIMATRLMMASGTVIHVSKHAVDSHGAENAQARNCMNKHGVFKAYLVIGTKEEHWLCQDDDGKIFDTIVSKVEKGIYENWNAFSPQDGSLKAVTDWLMRKGVQQIKPPSGPFNFIMP